MSSAAVVYCKYLPNITEELSIEANSVDPEQTAPTDSVDPEQTVVKTLPEFEYFYCILE